LFVWMWPCHNPPKPWASLPSPFCFWYHWKVLDKAMCMFVSLPVSNWCRKRYWMDSDISSLKNNQILESVFFTIGFPKNSEIKLTSTGAVLGWVTLQSWGLRL
jgi:hypothetical protein